jgi:hypothetical protein
MFLEEPVFNAPGSGEMHVMALTSRRNSSAELKEVGGTYDRGLSMLWLSIYRTFIVV